MAGTDRTRDGATAPQNPAVVLVEPQLGENIGACARAMLNCGLTEMRLVKPRDGWPNPKAEAMASGATEVLEKAVVFETTADAVADLNFLLATTARTRDMVKPAYTPKAAVQEIATRTASGQRVGVLFGPERAGLTNDDVALAQAVLAVPLNPAFSSLNLAQAVLLVGYEWFQHADSTPEVELMGEAAPAKTESREYFLSRLERDLEESGFFFPEELAPTIKLNLRALFTRANMTEQEVQTLHGVLRSLAGRRNRTEK